MIEVAATDAFVAWYETISIDDALAIEHAVAHIELQGSGYGPVVHRLGQGNEVRLHQLRIQQGGPAISLCYATDLLGRFRRSARPLQRPGGVRGKALARVPQDHDQRPRSDLGGSTRRP
jgi:hypothetical protein